MSEMAAEIDALALRIVLESEHGPEWLRQVAKRDELERLLLGLRKRGLSDRVVAEVWKAGDLASARNMADLTASQLAELNAVAQAAWA